MCERKFRNGSTVCERSIGARWALALAGWAMIAALLPSLGHAQSGSTIAMSAGIAIAGPVKVGDTADAAALSFSNDSGPLAGGVTGVTETVSTTTTPPGSIQAQLSCNSVPLGICGTSAGNFQATTVFTPSATGTGRTGSACAGVTFTISSTATAGLFNFTPASPINLNIGNTCTVDFTVAVNHVPTVDVSGLAGIQTGQSVGVQGLVTAETPVLTPPCPDCGLTASGTGTNLVTVNPATSTIVSTASTATLGGTASDSATVTGFGTLTGNVVFKLWGPAATPTCTNLVFTSAAIPVSGASPQTVVSGASSALTTAGTYYWTATFTDTDGNNTSSGPTACGAANESVTVVGCAPVLDKQVSCDGGAHFHDIGPSTTAAVACSGITNASDIVVRYIASEASGNADLFACTVTDSNGVITPVPISVGSVTSGGTPVTKTTSALACNSTTTTGEGDTATLSCACGSLTGPTVTATDSANFSCTPCGLTLDKQVSCNGGTTWVDTGSGTSAGRTGGVLPGGAAACTGSTGASVGTLSGTASSIEARYVLANTGGVALTCTGPAGTGPISDTNTILAGASGTTPPTTIAAGITATPIVSAGSPQLCTETLDEFETAGNTASLTCQCAAPTAGDTPLVNVTATDIAKFDCQTPGLTVSKTCVQVGTGTVVDDITINASNPASAAGETGVTLSNCVAMDSFFVNSSVCSGVTPTTVALTNGNPMLPTTLVPGTSTTTPATGSVPPPAFTSDSCNQGSVTCNLTGVTGGPATITAKATAICPAPPAGGCLIRTPGFWAEHPDITNSLLPLSSCGVNMTAAHDLAGTQGSAIEDLCSVGKDAKLPGTDQNLTQLARMCMSANLDLAATKSLGGGGCDTVPVTLSNGTTVSSGDIAQINNCCNVPHSVCGGGLAESDALIQSCLDFVGAFTGTDLDSGFTDGIGVFANPGPADPSICQDSKNNGFRNTCTTTSTPAAIPACGLGRP